MLDEYPFYSWVIGLTCMKSVAGGYRGEDIISPALEICNAHASGVRKAAEDFRSSRFTLRAKSFLSVCNATWLYSICAVGFKEWTFQNFRATAVDLSRAPSCNQEAEGADF